MDMKILELFEKSKDMLKKSYCPYSNFPVGAAVLCEDGTIFAGCNIENASYGLGACAERTAIFKAVSEGYKKFKAIAVACPVENEFLWPCGACRQVIAEFGVDSEVYSVKPDYTFEKSSLKELLPKTFTPEYLNYK